MEREHVRGAVDIPLEDLDSHIKSLSKEREIIVYCGSVQCSASYFAARKLSSLGFKVYRYAPELKGWREAGLPTKV